MYVIKNSAQQYQSMVLFTRLDEVILEGIRHLDTRKPVTVNELARKLHVKTLGVRFPEKTKAILCRIERNPELKEEWKGCIREHRRYLAQLRKDKKGGVKSSKKRDRPRTVCIVW